MKKHAKLWILISMVLVLLLAVFAATTIAKEKPARKIVVFKSGVSSSEKAAILKKAGATKIRNLKIINGQAISIPANAVSALNKVNGVAHLSDDSVVTIAKRGGNKPPKPPPEPTPDLTQTTDWGVERIGSPIAHQSSVKGANVSVAILDTGVDLDHADLKPVVAGPNFINSKKSSNDDNGHGSHVAGTIAARDNGIGTIGVAPEATIIAVKVLDRRGSGSWSGVIAALNWAIANDVDVVNMSLSGPYNQDVATAITLADQAGIVIVAAAGNSGGAVQYPAAFAETIAVSATDQNDNIAYFSSRGNNLSLAAPGVNIRSTFKNDGYKTYSGTSMASPHVAGAAALMLSQPVGSYDLDSDSTWDPNEARAKLQDRAEDIGSIGFDSLFGYGLVDADNLILP